MQLQIIASKKEEEKKPRKRIGFNVEQKEQNTMERGYIKIKENRDNQLIVEAKLINCTLWITKHEMADLFNVFVRSITNNLRSILIQVHYAKKKLPEYTNTRTMVALTK